MHSRVRVSNLHHVRGFTLIELMVSISIMVLITGVMVLQFSNFDSTTILRAHAYEVSHSVRAAQGYAASIRGTQDAEFSYRYGISFTKIDDENTAVNEAGETNIFVYRNSDMNIVPRFDDDAGVVELRAVPEGFSVTELCIRRNGIVNCNIENLDVSFRRPEAIASFYAKVGGTVYTSGIDMVQIKIQSGIGGSSGVIEIGTTGYISVSLEELVP